jgi:4-hydroxy-tetrahydrodipicolinate synthase
MVRFTHALLRGDEGEYGRLSGELAPLFDACFVESNPIPVKAALRILGLCSSEMRLPLTEATKETFGIMENVLGGLGL